MKPVPSDIPTLAAGATPGSVVARRAPAEPTVETDRRWVPVAIAGLLVLLAANSGAVALFLRRAQRSSAGAAPAPRIASAAVPPPPGALTGSAGRPAPAVRSGTEAHPTVGRPSVPRSLPRPVERAPVFVKGRARTLYLVQDGVKRPFASWAAFIAHGGKPTLANVRLLPEDALAAIPEGQPIEEARSA